MEPQTSTGQYSNTALAGVGIAVVFLSSAVGGIAGAMFAPARESAPVDSQQTFSVPTNMILSTEDIRSISGTVKALNGNRITISSKIANELVEIGIFVNNETKFIRLTQKDLSTAQAEMTEFSKKTEELKKGTRLIFPPDPFYREISDASGISVGDTVLAISNENISGKNEFIAREVQFSTEMNKNNIAN